MLVFRTAPGKGIMPPWLEGLGGVRTWQGSTGNYAAVGGRPDETIEMPADDEWRELGNAWMVAGEVVPDELFREQQWIDHVGVSDMRGVCWPAPQVLTEDGERAFRTRWLKAPGGEWAPAMDAAQTALVETAAVARQAIVESARDSGNQVPMAAMLDWAAQLLAATMHVDGEGRVLGALGALDEVVAMKVALIAVGCDGEPIDNEVTAEVIDGVA